jgi:lipopolysaccharide/colanic/teichoic acid biosynthesis glycosyltransferase
MLTAAVLVKLTSPGPIIYKQTRVGLNLRKKKSDDRRKGISAVSPGQGERRKPGRDRREVNNFGLPFTIYKFRTMRNGTGSRGSHMVDSDAVTKVGRILRRLKVDELPQAWNVLRGEMVLIGPRPCLPNQEEVIAARESRDVVNYSPGLTGWAQVNGVDMSEPETLAIYDSQYLGLQSVSFDLRIIRRTFSPFHRPPSG